MAVSFCFYPTCLWEMCVGCTPIMSSKEGLADGPLHPDARTIWPVRCPHLSALLCFLQHWPHFQAHSSSWLATRSSDCAAFQHREKEGFSLLRVQTYILELNLFSSGWPGSPLRCPEDPGRYNVLTGRAGVTWPLLGLREGWFVKENKGALTGNGRHRGKNQEMAW